MYYAQKLADRIPGARLQVLERGGHEALWEDPETGSGALLAFLVAGADNRTATHATP